MNPRTTGILFLVAALLGAFIYLYEIRGGEARRVAEVVDERLFSAVEAADIGEITLTTSDGQRARLERGDGSWRLTSPLYFAADDVVLEAMASALAQMEIAGRVQVAGAARDFGLDEGGGELRFRAAGSEYGLLIGRRTPVGSNTYVKTLSGDEIVYVQTWRTNALAKSLTELRDRRVLDFDASAVERVSVRWPQGRVEIERRGAHWWLVDPLTELADDSTLETLLSDLSFLRADAFIDDPATAGELGLDAPRFQVLLSGGSGSGEPFELGFTMGALRDGKRVARGGGGALYEISRQLLDDFPRDLVAYRFKQLARFEVADARRFELVFGAADSGPGRVQGELLESGWVTSPEPMAAGRAAALMAELARLEAVDIVADELGEAELAALGLSPPRVAIRVWGGGTTALAEVHIGLYRPGRGLLAQRVDSPVVYRLDETLSQRIPASREAFAEGFLAKPEPEP